jgi:CheY-like chemotaxis protein
MLVRVMAQRVLVVDDDPVIVRLIEVNLRLEGYEVATASRGDEALLRASESPPDLVICDVMMPGLDGWETCRRLRAQPAFTDTPVVLLSARARDDDRSSDVALGPVAEVAKPFDPVRLMELVGRLLRGGAASAPQAPQPESGGRHEAGP